jgi:integrase
VVDKARQEDAIAHLKAWFADTQIHEVNIPASRCYTDARRSGTVGGGARRTDRRGSESTIRRELVVLGAAARHALRWERITANELPKIELPAEVRSEAIGDDEYLTRDEYRLALTTAAGDLQDFILICYETASRRGAIERLTKLQVNLATGRIDLRRPGENQNQRRSKKRRPVVPITAGMRPVVERLLLETKNEWLFGSPRDMYRPFRQHMEAVGLGHKARPHILRHSRATHLLQSGVSLWDVAKLLGDTTATVEKVYGHLSVDHMAGVLKGSTE